MLRPKTKFELPLTPFKNRFNGGRDFVPSDCFNTQALGYKYDVLPSVPPQAMREPPTWAVFSNVSAQSCRPPPSYLHSNTSCLTSAPKRARALTWALLSRQSHRPPPFKYAFGFELLVLLIKGGG